MPCRSSTCPRGWIVGRFGVACPKPAKGTAQKAKRGRRRTLLVNDAAESAKVCERSGGRCEWANPNGWRCGLVATQVHHFLGGIGTRGRGASALAINKAHLCIFHHQAAHGW